MVKVGNSECEFLKLTPLSRSSAIAGAVCGVTIRPRRPSGTNRIRLRGLAFWADAGPAASAISPAASNRVVRRIKVLPHRKAVSAIRRRSRFSFALRQDCYIMWNRPQERYKPPRRSKVWTEETSEPRRRSPIARRPAMSKFQQKAEAQTKQLIGQMLGDELLVKEGKEQQREAAEPGS